MKRYFLTGLATLLPLAVTVYVVSFIVGLLTRPFMGIVTRLLTKVGSFGTGEPAVRTISQLLILLALFVCTLLIGFVGRWFFIHAILRFGEKIMQRIPVLNKVYKTTKEIVQTLFVSHKDSFKQVVLVRFPHAHCYCLGLVTREAPQTCNKADGEERVSIFIPTTPNPTTGFLIISPKSALIYLDMKSDDAIKYVVSCAVVKPGAAS